MKRGEVWWANLPPPTGHRPVLLLSRNRAYTVRSYVVVSPLTTVIRGIATEVTLGPGDGLSRSSAVNLDVIATIPKGSLQRRITSLSTEKLRDIERAIHFALALDR